MADNFVRNVVQWVTDTASLSKTVAETNKLGATTTAQAKRTADEFANARRITAQYDDTLGKLGATASANLTLLEQSMRDTARTTEVAGREVQDLTALYDGLEQQAKEAAAATDTVGKKGSSGSRVSGTLESLDRFGTTGSQVFGALGASGLAQGAGLLGDVAQGFSTLNPAMIAVTAAGAGLAIVMGDVQRQLEATRKEAEEFANKTVEAAELIASGATTADVQALIADQRGPADYIRTQLEALSAFENELEGMDRLAILSDTGLQDRVEAIFKEVSAITGTDVEDIGQLRANIQALGAEGNKYNLQVLQLNQLLESGALQANDTAAAFEANQEAAEEFVEVFKERFGNGLRGVVDTVTDFVEEAAEKAEAARLRADEARTERASQYIEAVDREVAAREKAFDIQNQIAETTASRDTRLLELQTDYYDRRDELTSDANDRSLEAVAVAEERRQKIIRDAGRSFNEAIGTRDANAYRLAGLTAKDALTDQQSTLQKQQENVTKGLDKQLTALDKGYAKQLDSTRTASSKQLSTLQQSLSVQLNLAQQAATSQAFITQYGMNSVINTTQNGWTILQNTFAQGFSNIAAAARGQMGGMGVNYQTAPTFSSSPQGRALDARIDQRLNYTIQLAGRSSPR